MQNKSFNIVNYLQSIGFTFDGELGEEDFLHNGTHQIRILWHSNKILIGFIDTFDRWVNSTDWKANIPYTKQEADNILHELTKFVKCKDCEQWCYPGVECWCD